MGKSIHLSLPHRLSVPEIRTRLEQGLTDFRASSLSKMVLLEDTWQGDALHVTARTMGQRITARLEPRPDTVEIEIDLPWAFAMFAGAVQQEVEQKGTRLLEEKK